LFGYILLFDISENLIYIRFELFITSKYFLSNYSSYYNNPTFNKLIGYKIVNIGFNLIKGYSMEITNNINYFSSFGTE
jgi:hypothetical protein